MCLDSCLDRLRCRIQPAEGVTLGPPTWTEEQRTIITLWRVQCFYELKNARIKGRLQNNWDATKLANLGSTTVYSGTFAPRGFQREQMITAHELLEKIKAEGSMSDIGQLPQVEGFSRRKFKKRPRVLLRLPSPGNHSMCCETPYPGAKARQSMSETISKEPTAWVYLHRYGRPNDADKSPLQRPPIHPFRNLGVFLWDRERLADLGLWPDRDRDILEFDEGPRHFSTWLGLLTPEEVAQAVEDDW
ncbi:hypothetical protein V8F06_014129 [Rhypophila decipiens]